MGVSWLVTLISCSPQTLTGEILDQRIYPQNVHQNCSLQNVWFRPFWFEPVLLISWYLLKEVCRHNIFTKQGKFLLFLLWNVCFLIKIILNTSACLFVRKMWFNSSTRPKLSKTPHFFHKTALRSHIFCHIPKLQLFHHHYSKIHPPQSSMTDQNPHLSCTYWIQEQRWFLQNPYIIDTYSKRSVGTIFSQNMANFYFSCFGMFVFSLR